MAAKLIKIISISFIIFLILPSISSAQDSQPIELLIPGRIEKVGTFFEVKDSEYLNITLGSKEEIKLVLESVPRMISLNIETGLSESTSTTLTIEGLEPNKSYFKYQDSYRNEAVFVSDEKGDYSWQQDVTKPHHIWIQENDSFQIQSAIDTGPIFIPEDCSESKYGNWNSATSTCTLNQDLTESVEIIQDNITLDCNKHNITGTNTSYGIYLDQRKGVTLKNCNINNFAYAVHLHRSQVNTIVNNNVSNNFSGIHPLSSNTNSLINNIVSNNYIGIYIISSNSNNLINNSVSGSNEGIILISSSGNIFTNNSISKNYFGISPRSSSNNNKIYHNNFIDNNYGAYVYPDSPNNFFDNGYPSGGNYWSDYSGKDLYSGPNQDQSNSDGIGDTPYGQDRYPFMEKNGWEKPQRWSFAIITDLHVGQLYISQLPLPSDYGDPTWDDNTSGQEPIISTSRLRESVSLINSNRDRYNIAFVVVDGDFSDSAELSELNKAKEILNNLEIPWIPIMGNHDVWPYTLFSSAPEVSESGNTGTDKFFNEIFNSQYRKLANIFQGWEKIYIPIWNLETDPNHYSYFQNFVFDYNNYHFIGLDFNYRDNWIFGVKPKGRLHNFSGGTWDWFTNHLQHYLFTHPEGQKNIILFVHHPFKKFYWKSLKSPFNEIGIVPMGFSEEELDTAYNFLKDYRDKILAQFAGHSHDNKYSSFKEIMQIVETGANVEGSLVRIVQVYPDGRIDYSKMLGNGITITAHSPIDLIITDPDNLTISKQLNEIPGASYFEEDLDRDGSLDDLIEIPERKLGDYQIRVIPEPTAASGDTYTLEVSTLEDSFGYTPFILAKDIPISEIPTEPYIFESQEREVTQLTYKGDLSGKYSDSINLSATLTDKDGNLLSNKTVTFEIGEQSISALTNENGVATALLTLNQIPGKYYFIETNFSGNEDYLPSVDSDPFEILKENVVITVLDKQGFYDDTVSLETQVLDDDDQSLVNESYEVEFKVGEKIIGTTTINENGNAVINWKIDLIPKEPIEAYPIIVTFLGNEYYFSIEAQGIFTLKSAKWLKQDAVKELKSAKTGNKLIDKKIDLIIWLINQSLNENLWKDASKLVFFEKNSEILDEKKFEEMFNKPEWVGPKAGIVVFFYEKMAVRLMMSEIESKKISENLKIVFKKVIEKLVKADTLLAKISIYDAENTPIKNPKFRGVVEKQIKKAKIELDKVNQELQKNHSDKAITRFAKAWFHSQLAIKFANLGSYSF